MMKNIQMKKEKNKNIKIWNLKMNKTKMMSKQILKMMNNLKMRWKLNKRIPIRKILMILLKKRKKKMNNQMMKSNYKKEDL